MAPAPSGSSGEHRDLTVATPLTATVVKAADSWFELHVLQLPQVVAYAASLDHASQAVAEAAAVATGRNPGDFDVHVQW